MAIDTTEKKLALLSFGRKGFTLPQTLDSTGELAHLLGLYPFDSLAPPDDGGAVIGVMELIPMITGNLELVPMVTGTLELIPVVSGNMGILP